MVFVFLHVHHGFVGVHHLFHIGALGYEVGEGGILVVVGVDLLYLFDGLVALGVGGHKDAPCKAAALWDEEHTAVVARTEFLYRLIYFQQMLVREGLVDRDIVVAPREMGRSTRLLAGSCATRNAVHVNISANDACL